MPRQLHPQPGPATLASWARKGEQAAATHPVGLATWRGSSQGPVAQSRGGRGGPLGPGQGTWAACAHRSVAGFGPRSQAPPWLSLWIQGTDDTVGDLPLPAGGPGVWTVGCRLSYLGSLTGSTHLLSTHLVPLRHVAGYGPGPAGAHGVGGGEAHTGTRGARADKLCPPGQTRQSWSPGNTGGSMGPPAEGTYLHWEMPSD